MWLFLAFASLCTLTVRALDNGVALKPPMGWSTWNTFGSNVSEALVRETVEALISSGTLFEFLGLTFFCRHARRGLRIC